MRELCLAVCVCRCECPGRGLFVGSIPVRCFAAPCWHFVTYRVGALGGEEASVPRVLGQLAHRLAGGRCRLRSGTLRLASSRVTVLHNLSEEPSPMERVILSGCSGSSSCRTPVRHRSDPEPGSRLHALLGPSARADVKRPVSSYGWALGSLHARPCGTPERALRLVSGRAPPGA